ncbi:unnamed protein product [Chondrus crispus]|uniref:Uncharacterized protein n=1 Tax=Chondrus crispus TaxID=2769 RepID=R7QQR2_CHOCR|nr:unnamed protein product [Chondrus crispus]CDF39725.1 unnamed protein product [Chondrus crispus]|eukprot:XP_005710019.1 unnamed protein product [Chondrus crispus]
MRASIHIKCKIILRTSGCPLSFVLACTILGLTNHIRFLPREYMDRDSHRYFRPEMSIARAARNRRNK